MHAVRVVCPWAAGFRLALAAVPWLPAARRGSRRRLRGCPCPAPCHAPVPAAQRPKMSPHKEAIRDNLCQMLGAHPRWVGAGGAMHACAAARGCSSVVGERGCGRARLACLCPPPCLSCPTPTEHARSVVNIKAKTHEKVDSLGENRSIACHAVVMLLKQ